MLHEFTCPAQHEKQLSAQARIADLLRVGAPEPLDAQDATSLQIGWENIHTHEVIPLFFWPTYCFAQCGIVVVDDSAPLCDDLRELVPDWVSQGDWVRCYGTNQ